MSKEQITPFQRQVLAELVEASKSSQGQPTLKLFFIAEKVLRDWGCRKWLALRALARKGYVVEVGPAYALTKQSLEILQEEDDQAPHG